MEFMSSLQNGFDDQKPSIFELLSEQQLSALIPPSIRYLLTIATHRHPRYLLRVLNSFDEIYALLMLAVERHYLKTYGGGFTENFYGLKRERVLRIKGGEAPRARIGAPSLMRETLQLRHRDVWNNLVIMIGLPYLKRKLDESYDIHAPQAELLGPNFNRDALPHDASIRQKILYYYKWFLRNIYPRVNAAYYFSLLAFNLAYLFDNTKYSSPFLWLIETRLRRLSEVDHRAIALTAEALSDSPSRPSARPGQSSSIFNPSTFMFTIYPRLLSSLKVLLPTSIFALKFLEWWHASDFARQLSKRAAEGLDLPPPVVSGQPHTPAVSTAAKAVLQSSSPANIATPNTVSLSSGHESTQKASPTSPASPLQATSPTPLKIRPPISSTTNLPIHTVPAPTASTSALCPICVRPIQTATSAQTGYVFCYTCIFKWVDGSQDRQIAFMEGTMGGEGAWDEETEASVDEEGEARKGTQIRKRGTREGEWESGKGRCAVSGRRVLGGTDGLRRVMV